MFRDLSVWARRASECRNPYILARALAYDRDRFEVLKVAAGLTPAQARPLLREIEDDTAFLTEVRTRLSRWTNYKPRAIDFMMYLQSGSVFFNEVTMYTIVRALQPAVMVETGGTPGKSSAFILRAMQRNGRGHLYTIDLTPPAAPEDKLSRHESWHDQSPVGAGSGWIVPDDLRERHTLLIGKSSEQLPPLLDKLNHKLDIFLHDSDHSYENMTWEFATAFPALGRTGLLLSDDVLANKSFFDFCDQHGLRRANVFNLGAARLP